MSAEAQAEAVGAAAETFESARGGPSAFARFTRHRLALVGAVVLAIILLLVIFAPLIARHDPNSVNVLQQNRAPSGADWFGTDAEGRDVLARTLYGGRVSLAVGVTAMLILMTLGTFLGGVSGYFRGWVDWVVMRVTDVVMAFPSIVITLTVAAIVGPGVWNTILIIGLLSWAVPARLVRSRILAIRETQFIEASRALGTSPWRTLLRHALPNTIDVVVVAGTLAVASAVLTEAGLSFLGLGIQAPTATWGNLLNSASDISVLVEYPWQWIPAAVALILTVLAINLIGDGVRDALDPRGSNSH